MKKALILAVVAAAALCGQAEVYTVAPGETLAVTDATAANYADGIAFEDDTGIVEFNTSAAPTMNITGAGTVKKTSTSDWTMTKELPNFTGTYILESGMATVNQAIKTLFGKSENGTPGPLIVKPGATLDLAYSDGWRYLFQTRAVHIAGTGKNGVGAVRATYPSAKSPYSAFVNLVLDGDATMNLTTAGALNTWFILAASNGAISTTNDAPTTLTLTGPGELQIVPPFKVATNVAIRATGSAMFTIRDDREAHDKIAMDPDDASPIILEDSARIIMYNHISDTSPYTNRATVAVDRPVTVRGANAMISLGSRNEATQNTASMLDRTRDDINNLKGDIALEPGSKLTVPSLVWFGQLQLSGRISGSGDLVLNSGNDCKGRLYISSTNNSAFTGSVTINSSSYHPRLLLGAPGSLPDYTELKVGSGFVSVDLRNWDVDSVKRLAEEADYSTLNAGSLAFIGLDTTFWGGVPMPFCYPGSATALPFGGCTSGTLLLTNVVTTAEDPLRVAHAGGTMRIESEGRPIYVGESTLLAHPHEMESMEPSVLEFANAEVRMGSTSPKIGTWWKPDNSMLFSVPRLSISNSTFIAESLRSDYSDVGTDALMVAGTATFGPHGGGALEVLDGSVVSSKLVVAGSTYYGKGAVYQRGGSVTALGSPTSWSYSSCIGCFNASPWTDGNHHGYYELSGGTFKALGRFSIGLGFGATWFQSGGYATLGKALGSDEPPKLNIGQEIDGTTSPASSVEMYISGGTFDVGDDVNDVIIPISGYNTDKFMQITVDGQDALLDFRNNHLSGTYKAASRTRINLCNGGEFRVRSIGRGNASSEFGLNFNGGVLRLCGDGVADVFHRYGVGLSYVLVHGGGATIETDGHNFGTAAPISGASGQGVTAIAMSAPIKNIAFPPQVLITGDGQGAAAVCIYDSKTSTISGIKVLCPGTGYTEATAVLRWGNGMDVTRANANVNNATYNFFLTCTLGDVSNAGSFTKAGEGTFTLNATNTWGGATVVKGGVLKAGADWAIPTNTAVVLAGGSLDFNGKTGEVSSVTYMAGGGAILNAGNVAFSGTTAVTVSTADLLAGRAATFQGDTDLSAMVLSVTGSADDLDDSAVYTVATVPEGMRFTGTPTISLDPSFDDSAGRSWRVKVRGRRVTLSVQRGMVLIYR